MATPTDTRPLALVYVRVSTDRQADDGHSLAEQERVLRAEAERRGYRIELVADEGRSGKRIHNRPGLRDALRRLDRRDADALLALDLDRVSRSVVDLSRVLDRAQRYGWTLIVLGLGGIDTGTPEGRMVAQMLAAAGEYESAMTSKRVQRQHEARRQRGVRWGVDEGPRPTITDDTRDRIVREHNAGRSLRAIADALNTDGIPTARGGTWHASTVRHVLTSPATTGERRPTPRPRPSAYAD